MLKAIPRIFILTTLSLMGSIALQAQNVLDNKTYRVTALQRGNNSITSMSNYAEVIPPLSIYIPNAFTPNADGLNDVFQPKGFGVVKYQLQIFDRWGERVFETKTFDKGWDGRFRGKGLEYEQTCEEGTYTWLINVTNVSGKAHELKGHVTLIK